VHDASSFARFYWAQQGATAGLIVAGVTGAALLGGLLFRGTQRRLPDAGGRVAASAA
jgi:hypothetical protein